MVKMRSLFGSAALSLAVLILVLSCGKAADEQPKKGNGSLIRVAPSGPIHESFAAPTTASLDPPPLVEKAPPKPLNEQIPDEKPDDDAVQWIPGYWDFDADNSSHVWVSGVWRLPPPDRQWVMGYWAPADGKWRRLRGFWTAVREQGDSQELAYYPKPPEPQAENPGDAPEGQSVFVPGSWTYAPSGYKWTPGSWVVSRPDWSWTAPSYSWTPAGYSYTNGYWDYNVASRGLAYAPVIVPPAIRNQANHVYRPTQVIDPGSISSSLVVGMGSNRYYFRNARFTTIDRVNNFKRVRVSTAQRSALTSLSKSLQNVATSRRQFETKTKRDSSRAVLRHRVNLPHSHAAQRPGVERLRPPPAPGAKGPKRGPVAGGKRPAPKKVAAGPKKPTGPGGKKPAGHPKGGPAGKKPGQGSGAAKKSTGPKKPGASSKKPAGKHPGKSASGAPRKPDGSKAGAHTSSPKKAGAKKPAGKKKSGGAKKASKKPVAKKGGGKKGGGKKGGGKKGKR